jgi:O-antigen/teichoic acid export membrane protein
MTIATKINDLKNRQGFMRYFKNTSWLMGEKILRMVVGLFVGIWVARYLGPEQFGLLSYAQSFVFLFTAIATLGLDGIVIRELVKDESQRDKLLGTAFVLKLLGAICIFPILAVAIQLTNNDGYINLLVFIIASATIFQSFNVIDFYYQSQVLSKYVALANSACLGFSSIIKIVLLINHAPLIVFALMILFDAFVLSIGLICFYVRSSRLKILKWTFDWQVARCLLNDSWPLILTSVLISINMRIDQVMVKGLLSSQSVGLYAVAVRLSEAWYFIPVVIVSSLFPAIIKAKNMGEKLYYSRIHKLYVLLVASSVIVALPMAVLSDWLVLILFGQEFIGASQILKVYVWAGVLVFWGVGWSKWVICENKQKLILISHGSGVVLNICFNFYFIENMGVVGAAYATVLSYFLSAVIGVSLYRQKPHGC